MKGQINFEFLAAAGFYLIALGIVVTASSPMLPTFAQETGKNALNLEARSVTNYMLSSSGRHDYGTGGTNWEKNSSTLGNITSFGLANDFLEVERDKIMALQTVGDDKLNYSVFKNLTDVKNQYKFNFTWYPTVDTHRTFTRGNPPSNPPIREPSDNNMAPYNQTGNTVHYGSIILKGRTYRFLVTSRNGIYNGTYISKDWNFYNQYPQSQGETFTLYNTQYRVKSFQNRDNEPGSLVILQKHLKTFGAATDSDAVVINMQRFAAMEGEPLKMGVWAW